MLLESLLRAHSLAASLIQPRFFQRVAQAFLKFSARFGGRVFIDFILLFELLPIFDGEENALNVAFGVGEIFDVHEWGRRG
jgi:hypothetical protein